MQDLYGEFKALITTFNAEGVPYAVCGGLAFAIHVEPRATVDIDLLIREADVERCQHILMEMGYTPHPKPMAFAGGAVRIQRLWKPQEQGGDVLMVDLLIANDEAMPGVWEGREEMRWEDMPVWVVSRHGLVILKHLRGSKQDIADMERLGDFGVDQ